MEYQSLNEEDYRVASILLETNSKIVTAIKSVLDALRYVEELNIEFDLLSPVGSNSYSVILDCEGVWLVMFDGEHEYRTLKE